MSYDKDCVSCSARGHVSTKTELIDALYPCDGSDNLMQIVYSCCMSCLTHISEFDVDCEVRDLARLLLLRERERLLAEEEEMERLNEAYSPVPKPPKSD
jgi:hypothetical protein